MPPGRTSWWPPAASSSSGVRATDRPSSTGVGACTTAHHWQASQQLTAKNSTVAAKRHSSRLAANVKPDADVLLGHHSSSSNLEVSRGPAFRWPATQPTSQNASCRRCKPLRQQCSGGYCIRFTYRPDGRRRTARTARTAGRQGVKPEIHGRPPDTEPVWSGPTGVSHDTRARRRRNRGVFCAVLRSQFAFGIFL